MEGSRELVGPNMISSDKVSVNKGTTCSRVNDSGCFDGFLAEYRENCNGDAEFILSPYSFSIQQTCGRY
jgi:hypothetical protein